MLPSVCQPSHRVRGVLQGTIHAGRPCVLSDSCYSKFFNPQILPNASEYYTLIPYCCSAQSLAHSTDH